MDERLCLLETCSSGKGFSLTEFLFISKNINDRSASENFLVQLNF